MQNKKLDILFIHPNASDIIYQDLSKNAAAIEPPIWAAMLANSTKLAGFACEILDCEVLKFSFVKSAEQINDINPRVACFVVYGQQPSASAQNMIGATEVAKLLKQLNSSIKILFVGGYVAALPKKTMEDEESIDFVCLNEGVYSIQNILKTQKLNDDSSLKKINGIAFRDSDNKIVINSAEKIVPKEALSSHLPGIDWSMLPSFKDYRTAGWHSWTNNSETSPFAALYTSLGCPYKCSFCMINIINRTNNDPNISSQDSNVFRWWQPEFIIKQFEYFAENNVKNIKIADELFVLNPNHFIKICDMIIERGYDFNIWAYSRIDTAKPQYLEKLRKAGVKWLGLGIENPNDVIRKEIHKGAFQEVNIMSVIKEMQNHDINVAANYIFGLPNETEETMKSVLDFAMEANTEMVNFYCAMAYPGSPLYLQAVEKHIELPPNYSGYSQHSYDTLNLPSENLTSNQILKFRDYAWNKYHTNESYLNLLQNKFGTNAVQNLKKTTAIKLKRKNA